MNTSGRLIAISWQGFFIRFAVTTVIAVLVVPCFIVQNNNNKSGCCSVSGNPSVSSVTAYADPYWKNREKLRITTTTSTPSPAVIRTEKPHPEFQKRFYTQSPPVSVEFQGFQRDHAQTRQNLYTKHFPFENESPIQTLAQKQNMNIHKKRKGRPSYDDTSLNNNKNSNINHIWKRQSLPILSSQSTPPVDYLDIEIGTRDLYPRRRNRRRRLTRRRKTINRYFRPETTINNNNDDDQSETDNVVSSIEPVDSGSHSLISLESVESKKFVEPPPPSITIEQNNGFWRDRQQQEQINTDDIAASTTSPEMVSTSLPKKIVNSSENDSIVIYERGEPKYQNRPKTVRIVTRRRKIRRKNDQHKNIQDDNDDDNNTLNITKSQYSQVEEEEKEEKREEQRVNKNHQLFNNNNDGDEESDLHSSESFNPFLNSSTPISNDLRHSLAHNLELLHPLFNSDTSLKDVYKIPENKTIGIKHMLSDQPVAVRVAPDLHMDLHKAHSLLNHDSIISSDYDQQVYKNRPQIHVKHSVSMSTSSTSSSSASTSSPSQTRPTNKYNHDHHQPTGDTTSVMTPTTTPTRLPTILRTKSPTILSVSPSKNTYSSSSSSTTRSRSTTTTNKPILVETKREQQELLLFTFPPFQSSDIFKPTRSPTLNGVASHHKPSSNSLTTTRAPLPETTDSSQPSTTTTTAPTPKTRATTTHRQVVTLVTKIPFTLRPKTSPTTAPTTTSQPITAIFSEDKTIASSSPSPPHQHQSINTFLDNIDENSGKNTWTPPAQTPSSIMLNIESSPDNTPTRRPTTEKIKLNKDPPLILMPPFNKNDKDVPIPITLTTPDPNILHVTSINNNNNNNETALLQQLLADLGVNLSDITDPQAKSPSESTTKSPPPPPPPLPPSSTTTRRPTTVRTTTPAPLTTQQANDLFNLFNLFAPQSPVAQRPTTTSSPTTANDFFNLLNLFQPSTPTPFRQVTTAPPNNNGLFNGLFNLFQPAPTTPAPARNNDLFNIFNLFAPQTTTTRRPQTTTPAPNDLFGLLNLFGGSSGSQQTPRSSNNNIISNQHRQLVNSNNKKPSNPQSELEALVQQALLESLGVKTTGGGSGLFSQQATNLNQQLLASPNSQNGTSNGLTDADLKTIYALIDQQGTVTATTTTTPPPPSPTNDNNNSSSTINEDSNNNHKNSTSPQTTTTKVPTTQVPSTTTQSTTTLMPIFRNMLNLFGITDPTTAPASTTKKSPRPPLGPVYNPMSTPPPKIDTAANNNFILQLFGANTNSNNSTTSPPVKTPDTSLDLLTQLFNLGQVVENTKSTTTSPQHLKTTNQEASQLQQLLQQQQLFQQQANQQQQRQQQSLDIQSIRTQGLLPSGNTLVTTPKPEESPSDSNIFQIIANQFTPKPQRPNGLYYWVDLNAFMGDQASANPYEGIRPKLGQKDFFLKVKREASPERTGKHDPSYNTY